MPFIPCVYPAFRIATDVGLRLSAAPSTYKRKGALIVTGVIVFVVLATYFVGLVMRW